MKLETIEKILNFLQNNEDKEIPRKWVYSIRQLKFINELENHPDGVQYKHNGNLYLPNSKITKLPNDLYVTKWLDLESCEQLTELPDKLYVGSVLNLRYSNITKLPDNLYVGEDLVLDFSEQITELPNNLYVVGNLWLYGTKIEDIPNNLYVGLNLYIDTPLAEKYTDEEIYKIVMLRGGQIIGEIFR